MKPQQGPKQTNKQTNRQAKTKTNKKAKQNQPKDGITELFILKLNKYNTLLFKQ